MPDATFHGRQVLTPSAAVDFFAERYAARRQGAWDAVRDTPAATAIVRTLGYLPLAIELAAVRAGLRHTSVAALADELAQPDVLDRLKNPLDNDASVRYEFERSLAQFTPDQRVRFAALGLPDGLDWPRPAIERMLAAVPPDVGDTPTAANDLDLLAAFSLVIVFAPGADLSSAPTPDASALVAETDPRVRLHPLLRVLAREEWARQPTATRTAGLTALLEGVNAFVAQHKDVSASAFVAIAREEELTAGTLRQAGQAHVALEPLAATVAALNDYLNVGGHWLLGLELLALQLEARRALGDRAGEGTTLNNLGELAYATGRPLEAARYYERALVIRREVGDRAGEGETLHNLGALACLQSLLDEAARYFERALAILREVGNRAGEGITLASLGFLARSRGHLDEAGHYYDQALVILREAGDRSMEGTTLNNIGALARSQSLLDEAGRYFEQALVIAREAGDRAGEGSALNNLGGLAYATGRPEEAARYYEQALTIFEEIGAVDKARVARRNLAALHAATSERSLSGWLPTAFGLAAALVVVVLARYPIDLARNGADALGAGVAIVVLLGLGAWAMFRRRHAAADAVSRAHAARLGAIAGVVFGVLWLIEIGYNNLLAPPIAVRDPVDNVFWGAIALGMLAIAAVAAARARSIAAGLRAGAWSGLVSGLIACLTGLCLIVFGMPLLLADPINRAEWAAQGAASGFATMSAYFAYQTLAGAVLHLIVLGVVMGALLGLLGGLFGRAITPRAPKPRATPSA